MKRKKMLVQKKQTNKQKKSKRVLLCNRLYSSGLCLPCPGHVRKSTTAQKRKSQQQNHGSNEIRNGIV